VQQDAAAALFDDHAMNKVYGMKGQRSYRYLRIGRRC
jgi:hypothetical protein